MAESAILIDGGLSTALESIGQSLTTSLWSAELLRSNPAAIRAAHQLFVDAGARLIISSSYQLSYPGAQQHGWSESDVTEALLNSTELARFPGVTVAASIGPYGAHLADGSEYRGNYGLSIEELKDFHRRRLEVLIQSNPDFLFFETIPELSEAKAVLELVEELNPQIDICLSFSCRSKTELSSGELFRDAVALVSRFNNIEGDRNIFVGINCTAPELITDLLKSAQGFGIKFVIYPNSGREWDAANKIWFGEQSEAFSGSTIAEWIELGARFIGGCCGVGARDIANIQTLLR